MSRTTSIITVAVLGIMAPLFLRAIYHVKRSHKEKPSFERKYEKPELQLVHATELNFLTTQIRVVADKIFLDDFYARQIVQIDDQGRILKRFGKKGKGPAEFMRIEAWDVDNKGLYVCDPDNLRITEMDLSGNVYSSFKLDKSFIAGNRLREGIYVLFSPDWSRLNKHELFVCETADSTYTDLDITFLRKYPGLALGNYIISGEKCCILAWYQFGYILGINKKGRILFRGNTIDKTPPPKIIIQNGLQVIDPDAPVTIQSGYTDGNRLYLISTIRSHNEVDEHNLPIDVYDSRTGTYLFSFYVPLFKGEPPTVIAVDSTNDRILAYQGESLTFYKIKSWE